MRLRAIDDYLLNIPRQVQLVGFPRFLTECLFFGIKEARAGLFFAAVFLVPRGGLFGYLWSTLAISVWYGTPSSSVLT